MAEPMVSVGTDYVPILIKLPPDLLEWLDLHVAELKVQMIRAKQRNVPAPNRARYIRGLIERARREQFNKR